MNLASLIRGLGHRRDLGRRAPAASPPTAPADRPAGMFRRVVDRNGRISFPYISLLDAELFGIDPAALMADASVFIDLIHPEDRLGWREVVAATSKTLERFDHAYRIVNHVGETRHIRTIAQGRRRDDGAVVWDGVSIDVTEQRRAAEVLRDREAQLAEIANNIPGAVYRRVLHADGRITIPFHSGQDSELVGNAIDADSLSDNFIEWIDPPHREAWKAAVHASATKMERFDHQYRVRSKSGAPIWLRSIAKPKRMPNGEVVWDGVGIDITAQKEAEQQLQTSEQRFRDFANAASDWLWETDPQGRFIYLSPGFAAAMGRAEADALTHTPWDIAGIDPDAEPAWRALRADLAARAPFRDFACIFTTPDGGHRHARMSGVPAFDIDDRFIGYRGTARDITERVRAEEALRENVAKLRAVLESIADEVFVKDLDGRYILYNAAGAALLGRTVGEFLGRTAAEVLPPATAERIAAADREIQETGLPTAVEIEIDVGGISHHILTVRNLYRDRNGKVAGIVGVGRDITSRKHMEDELREREATLRAILEGISDSVFVKDLESRVVLLNEASRMITGQEPSAVIGLNTAEIFPCEPDRIALYDETDRQLLKTGEPVKMEFTYTHEGQLRHAITSKSLYRDTDDRPLGIVGVTRDITERKHMEEALREREARLRAILYSIDDAVFVKDSEGRHVLVNKASAAITGLAADQIIGLKADELGGENPQLAALYNATDKQLLDTGRPVSFDLTYRKGGELRHAVSKKSLYRDARGRTLGIVGVTRDITERKHMEEALREGAATLRAILDGISDFVYVKDLEGRYTLVSGAADDYYGLPIQKLIGHTSSEIFPPDVAAIFEDSDREALETGAPVDFEVVVSAEGRRAHYMGTKSVYRDNDGRALGLVGVARDVTEHRRMEAELHRAQRMEAIGRLTGGIAHDFNNLFAIIVGSLELLDEQIQDNDDMRRRVRRAMEASHRGAALTERLLVSSSK